MKVVRAAKAGFCMGVSLALTRLERAIASSHTARRICTLGPIIHNPQVLGHFQNQGVACLDNAADAAANDHVLIRAHGIPRSEEELLRNSCAVVEDATCPKVKRAQLAIARATASGPVLLLFGEKEHPEVAGLISYAAGHAYVFGSLAEVQAMEFDPGHSFVLASQTTQDREIFDQIAEYLRQRIPKLEIFNTICDATRQRQAEALQIAAAVDIMVIVGGKSSGNTRRLADMARQTGVTALHVETCAELDKKDFTGCSSAGLTAGASTPAETIDEVENWLEQI